MSLLSIPAQIIVEKAINKAIAKEAKKEQEKTVSTQTDTYYNGIYMFGMDTYVTMKLASRFMYAIAIFITLIGLIAGVFVTVLGILFGLFTYAMAELTTRSSGFILYTNNYIKIIKKDGAESTTLSISGLKSLEVKYPHYIFVGQEGTAKVVSGGGKGFADFVDHLNERRPELIETFYQNKNVSNAYYCDRNNMHTYNY